MAVDPVRRSADTARGIALNAASGPKVNKKGQVVKKNPVADNIAKVSRDIAMGNVQRKNPLQEYLANDATFQRQVSRLNQERDRYLRDYDTQRGRANSDFGTARDRLLESRTRASADQGEMLAVRGIDASSIALDEQNKLNQQYAEQESDLVRDRQRVFDDLLSNRQTFQSGLKNERLNARQEAIRRRTQKLGIRR